MEWNKLGIVWKPCSHAYWAQTHATCPTPVLLDDTLRVYFASRDLNNVGRIGFVDLNPNNPTEIIAVSEEPALDVGLPGTFDDNGVVATSIVQMDDGRLFLYYAGFELSHHIRQQPLCYFLNTLLTCYLCCS